MPLFQVFIPRKAYQPTRALGKVPRTPCVMTLLHAGTIVGQFFVHLHFSKSGKHPSTVARSAIIPLDNPHLPLPSCCRYSTVDKGWNFSLDVSGVLDAPETLKVTFSHTHLMPIHAQVSQVPYIPVPIRYVRVPIQPIPIRYFVVSDNEPEILE